MKLNEIQEIAVREIDKNISLVAGAGTGKTRVLTNRYVEIIKNTPSSRVLALTFTKKAAGEMKTRILQNLLDENINREDLNVMTIHSFCLEVIREYVDVLELDPDFKVSSEKESKILIEKAILKSVSEEKSEKFLKFIEDFSLDERNLISILYKLYLEIKNHNIDLFNLEKITFKTLTSSIKLIDLKEKLLSLSKNKSLKKLNKFVESNDFNEIFSKKDYTENELITISENLGSSKKFILEIKEINNYLNQLSIGLDYKNFSYYEIIILLLKNIDKNYTIKKRELGLIDYDDQMILINELLNNKEIINEIENRYTHILVDEFQDTNELQNEIIKKLNAKSLFIVGDPKQSIYGFRGSEISSYYNFSNYLEKKGISLNMDLNYRSSKNLVSDINSIFKNLIDNYVPLSAIRESTKNIEFFEVGENENSSLQKLVVNLLEEYKYEDILILSRSNNELDEIYKLLREEGIPSKKPKVFLTEEPIVKYVLNLLSSLYNREDLLGFLTYINSSYINLDFDIIVKILLEDVKTTYDILKLNIKNENFIKAINLYKKLLKYKDKLFIDEIVNLIIIELSKFNNVSKVEYEYLYVLVDKAREFLEEHSNNFRDFEEYLSYEEIEDLNSGVTISTIHRSKGLEYNVVILYNMEKKLIQNKDKFLIDKDLGLAIDSQFSSGKHKAIKEKLNVLEEEEEKRVFYVATTRAKDRLIFASRIKNSEVINYYNFIKDMVDDFERVIIDSSRVYVNRHKEDYLENIGIREKFYRYRENYSISDFLNFRISKRYFYENYYFEKHNIINNLNKNYLIDPVVRGNIVHEFAAKYDGVYDEKFVKKIFENQRETYSVKKFNYIKRYLDNYLKIKAKDIRNRELEFYYNFKNNIIRGFIDQIIYDDGYYLIDLKTSESLPSEMLKYYAPQLQIYSKIYEDIYGVKLKGAYIYSLYNSEKIEVDISKDRVEETLLEFYEFINFIRTHIKYKDY